MRCISLTWSTVGASTFSGTTPTRACNAAAAACAFKYELYAVLVHSGSATFGHYYALIKDVEAGEWHEFNDSTVRPIKESELMRTFGSGSSVTATRHEPSASSVSSVSCAHSALPELAGRLGLLAALPRAQQPRGRASGGGASSCG